VTIILYNENGEDKDYINPEENNKAVVISYSISCMHSQQMHAAVDLSKLK
jgi:hypothetical protein